MKKYVIILIFLCSCMVQRPGKAGIYGLSHIQKQEVNGFIEYSYVIHFTKDTDRYSVYYYRIIEGEWVQADVIHSEVPTHLRKQADRSIGIRSGFTTTHDVRVKVEIIAYYPTSQFGAVTKQYSHVFE